MSDSADTIRSQLDRAAEGTVSPAPIEDLLVTGRHRLARRRLIGTVVAASVAAAAIVGGISIALLGGHAMQSGTSVSHSQADASSGQPESSDPVPGFHVTVAGLVNAAHESQVASYSVTAGQRLTIEVSVSVPQGDLVTDLWLGLSPDGRYGVDSDGPLGESRILLHVTRALPGGHYRFRERWTVPSRILHQSPQLVATVAGRDEPPSAQPIATFHIRH